MAPEVLVLICNPIANQPLPCWRDRAGLEVDLVMERGPVLHAAEIKSGRTIAGDFFTSLAKWSTLAANKAGSATLVYGGEQPQRRTHAAAVPWRQAGTVFEGL